MSRAIKLVIPALLIVWASFFALKQTSGFTIYAITGIAYDKKGEVRGSVIEEEALDQPYFYDGFRDNKWYQFISSDGKYLLKFFDQHRFSTNIRQEKMKCAEKQHRDFTSCHIANFDLEKQTSVMCAHLGVSTDLPKKLTLIDVCQIEHQINPNEFQFVLQKRGESAYQKIKQQMDRGSKTLAKESIAQLVSLVSGCCQKGCYNRDSQVIKHCEFIGGRPFLAEIGKLGRDKRLFDPEVQKEHLKQIMAPFHEWLLQQDAELAAYLQEVLM